jgi:hypothetical protein
MAHEVMAGVTTVREVNGAAHVHERRRRAAVLYPGEARHVGSAITSCLIRNGTTGLHEDFGNSFSETFALGIGPGFRCVNVQLAGWYLDYVNDDHHINTAQVRISNVTYNSTTGEVTFTVSGYYRDKNGDDDFTWEVWYTVLALG